ncbi:MAG: metallophosphoesterase [Myxococcota bacterium]
MNRRRHPAVLALVVITTALGCAAITRAVLQAGSSDPSLGRNLPTDVPPEDPGKAYLRFLVVGDWGTGGEGQRKVADAMVERATRVPVDLVLMTGDNFYPDGVTSVDDPQWRGSFEQMYLRGALASVPFYAVLGNHDYRGNPEAQLEYSRTHPAFVMPARYYAFTRDLADGTRVDFFALDTTPLVDGSPGSQEQLEWFRGALSTSRAPWKIVMAHHPLYSVGVHGNSPVMQRLVEDLLVEHRVQAYFSGHDHHLELHKPVRGVHHVVSGAGGGLDRPYPADWSDQALYVATRGGFVAARLDREQLVLEFVRPDARTQFAYTLPRCSSENTRVPCPEDQTGDAGVSVQEPAP